MRRTGVKLTKRLIDSFRFEGVHPKAQDIRWDSEETGFGVRVYPSGRKAYVVAYRDEDDRKHIINVKNPKDCGTLTVDEARKRAKAILADVGTAKDLKRKGIQDALPLTRANPAGARKSKAPETKTVSALVEAFLDQYAGSHLKPRTVGEYRRQIETHIRPRWGSRPTKSVRWEDVAQLHTEIGARAPIQANRVLMLIASLFTFAEKRGFVDKGSPNPAHGHDKYKEHKRDRWVRPAELPRLVEAINAEPNVYMKSALWLYLLTGLRKSELLRAKWEDVDEDRREIRLPETKAGHPHYVPLSEAALSVLSGIPRQDGNPYILPALRERRRQGDSEQARDREAKHLVNIDQPWRRIRAWATLNLWRGTPKLKAIIDGLVESLGREPTLDQVRAAIGSGCPAGIEDVRIHDLRRTVGSWLATNGESLPLIGKVLNHADVKTTAIYARLAEDPARRAMEEHGRRIVEVAKGVRLVK